MRRRSLGCAPQHGETGGVAVFGDHCGPIGVEELVVDLVQHGIEQRPPHRVQHGVDFAHGVEHLRRMRPPFRVAVGFGAVGVGIGGLFEIGTRTHELLDAVLTRRGHQHRLRGSERLGPRGRIGARPQHRRALSASPNSVSSRSPNSFTNQPIAASNPTPTPAPDPTSRQPSPRPSREPPADPDEDPHEDPPRALDNLDQTHTITPQTTCDTLSWPALRSLHLRHLPQPVPAANWVVPGLSCHHFSV